MSKVTKTQLKEFVKNKLSTDPIWAKQALLHIYEFQTKEEQSCRHTIYENGVGFSGCDGEILTSLAKQFIKYKSLSPKQMDLLMKKIPKYWMQVIRISDKEKLNSLVS